MPLSTVLLATAIALACPRTSGGVDGAAGAAGTVHATASSIPASAAEHRYRIGARIRLGLFSAGKDNIGSARMTWRSSEGTTAHALLAGSDPLRAPGGLNRWAYLREEVRSDDANVFTLRSDDAAPEPRHEKQFDDAPFNAACASVTDHDVRSFATTVSARGATYRMVDRMLADLEGSSAKWSERRVARPPGSEPGVLSALHRLLESTRGLESGAPPTVVPYLFNNQLYELSVKRIRRLGATAVGSRTFARLTRIDLMVRNAATRDVTRFTVTTDPDSADVPLPVQIFFQPNFWVVVELRLDDQADVPRDPADDGTLLTRMRQICASVTR